MKIEYINYNNLKLPNLIIKKLTISHLINMAY